MIRTDRYILGEIVLFLNPALEFGLGGNGQLWEIIDIMDKSKLYIDTVVLRHVTKGIEVYASDYELTYIEKISEKSQKLAKLLYK